jgi:hypothetical protein
MVLLVSYGCAKPKKLCGNLKKTIKVPNTEHLKIAPETPKKLLFELVQQIDPHIPKTTDALLPYSN